MRPELVHRLAGISVPRYTSYPTAADFSPAVGPADTAFWLGQLPPGEPVSIYLHVPYCRALCHYCGCHAKAVRHEEIVARYAEALEAEIALMSGHLKGPLPVSRIAWGGGTPSILGLDGLSSVITRLRDRFAFLPGMEHAIELDPRTLDQAFCDGLAALGITRASLGVQDLDTKVQQAIGRVQPSETVRSAVAMLRGAGIARLNFDLIYGLPHQTRETLVRTSREVIALGPDRVACYGYAHLPGRRANQRLIDADALPLVEERVEQSAAVAETFVAHGYQPIGIDHFALFCDPLAAAARSGLLHRNFQGYTDDASPHLLGFGASSISRLPGGFAQNETDIAAYKARVLHGSLATRRGHAVSIEDRKRAVIIERLMCDFRVDLGCDAHQYPDELALLRPFVTDGLLELKDNAIKLTRRGRPLVRLVSALFDQFRSKTESHFSRAI